MRYDVTRLKFTSSEGTQTYGREVLSYQNVFQCENKSIKSYHNHSINAGEETTVEKINRQLKKYDEVWKALS